MYVCNNAIILSYDLSLVLETALESTESVIILSVSGLHALSILKVLNA